MAFMTTPDTHNDTYAATAHRMFFANWVKKGRPTEGPKLRELADNDGHNTDSVDGLINVLPLSAESALAEDASTSRKNCKIIIVKLWNLDETFIDERFRIKLAQ